MVSGVRPLTIHHSPLVDCRAPATKNNRRTLAPASLPSAESDVTPVREAYRPSLSRSSATMPESSARNRRVIRNGKDGQPAVDQPRIEAAVREILLAVGEDPDREGLQETPARVARMYAEIFAGLHRDPRELLRKTFTQKYDEIVLVKDIRFTSTCEHH